MGYIEETGIAQRYPAARIAPIYEGTNGIQAVDLVSRKVRRDGGTAMQALIDELSADSASAMLTKMRSRWSTSTCSRVRP